MTNNSEQPESLSPNKLALLKIRELKQQLADAQRVQAGDIAIVSMACRFPRRSNTPEAFWNSLMAGTDEVGEVPKDRWDLDAFYDEDPEIPGKMYARHGVFLDDLHSMDPEFFGISPREATWVDPQQRLLLEVSWEAIERAGWPVDKIGDETGVFIGWMHNDYQNEASDSFLNLNPYIATGAAGSFLSGRLAYYLGLHGPSVAVDTACSSSLVALHLACQSLHQHECDRALVGAVNAIISPTTNILTCKLKALSPQGHSRAFDAGADGYLRGEGCGVLTLRRLADAQRDGDPILGVVKGSAVGHNGFSSGLTAPNPKAQERVIREALERAGVDSSDIGYLEAHGTGTELGDPLEMQAAAAALAAGRDSEHPLLVGSVKTNIGHLEAAAGMAGLIKVLLSMKHDKIPGQLNFEEPNPHIPWDQLPVEVLVKPTEWPNPARKIAGVSAFGMSGTNAHVVIEEPPQVARHHATNGNRATTLVSPTSPPETSPSPQLIVMSGKSDEAVQELGLRYYNWLAADPQTNLANVAFTTGYGRRHFESRTAIVVNDHAQALELLDRVGRSSTSPNLIQGQSRGPARVAWQFTGQGSQYLGMGRGLYESEPVFREAVDFCEQRLQDWRGESLLSVLFDNAEQLNQTYWTQPAIFALQMGLSKLLNHWGFKPDAVMGHSVGQFAAACVAGVLSWEDGLKLISERGRLIGDLPIGGAMIAVFANEATVTERLSDYPNMAIAAMNGSHIVISGPEEDAEAVAECFQNEKIRCKRLTTSHAFHSSLMEPVLEPFRKFAEGIQSRIADIPLICNVSGSALSPDAILDGEYWSNHIRQPVQYAASVNAAHEIGCNALLEIGPQAILTAMAGSVWPAESTGLISCLQKPRSVEAPSVEHDRSNLLAAAGRLYVLGLNPDFENMHSNESPQRVLLPTYPFQRREFWGPDKPRAFHAAFHTAHPLLGGKCSLAGLPNEERFESHVAEDDPPWLPDHEVMDQIVVPGAALIEIAIAAAEGKTIKDVAFEQPIRPTSRTAIQTILRKSDDGATSIEIHSSPEESADWTRNLRGSLAERPAPTSEIVDRDAILARCPIEVSATDFYRGMLSFGLNYGPRFQTVSNLHHSDKEVLVHLKSESDQRGFTISPTLLDGAFHALAVGLLSDSDSSLYLPVGMDKVEWFQPVENEVWCHAVWTEPTGDLRTADLNLFDDSGRTVGKIENLRIRRLDRAALRKMSGSGAQRLLYETHWKTLRLSESKLAPKRWLVVHQGHASHGNNGAQKETLVGRVVEELEQRGHKAITIALPRPDGASFESQSGYRLESCDGEQWQQSLSQIGDEHERFTPDGVLWLLFDEGESLANQSSELIDATAQTRVNCDGILGFVSALHAENIRSLECGLQFVTMNAIPVSDGTQQTTPAESESPGANARGPSSQYMSISPEQSQYWGLGRVLGAEQPEFRCRLIDLRVDSLGDAVTASSLLDIVLNDTRESQFALHMQQSYVPRLKQTKLTDAKSNGSTAKDATLKLRADASYLITGGLGMLGRRAAEWLAQHGARHLVLVSRRPPTGIASQAIDAIRESGCEVVIHQADSSLRPEMATLINRFDNELPPLAGVIHAAGVLDDGLLIDQTWQRFETVLAPKINGARWLHELTLEKPLDFFVLYSSAASVLGSPGQSNYATANAFMDGLAWHRRALGLPATSINWGPWIEGMADDEKIVKRLALQGISLLTVAEAHQAMEKMLAAELVQQTVFDADWSRMRMGLGGEAPPLLEEVAPGQNRSRSGGSELVEKLRRLPVQARKELLVETIQGELQEILATPQKPEIDRPLIEMGLDSLMAVEFGVRLQSQLGDDFAFAPTLLFDHPTIDAISDYVLDSISEISESTEVDAKPDAAASNAVAYERDDVAIIGMNCRFPGATNVDEFWNNLLNGVDSVGEIPDDRWDVDEFYSPEPQSGKMYTREGGFLPDIGDFDADFFNVSDQEACWIDPQHRMMLEVSWNALENAGIAIDPLPDRNVGVFMGIMSSDYAFLPRLGDADIIDAFQGAGLAHSAGVGRISHMFGFEGPSLAIDTASSSSLVSVCQAVRSLQEGNCNLALAGGVNAILAPVNSLLMSKAGLLSPDGRCKSFSADANGFGRGEGCGVVVLKRLKDAQRDGDRILAVVRGGAIGHNGLSGGLTAPSGRSQAKVIADAYADAKIPPAQVQYLEAHGTGTEFGDPMEIGAASSILGKGRSKDNKLLVGSVKANISHLEAAGGISGLIKTVLAVHHGVIPRQLHFEQPSPHVPWKKLPVQIVTETTPWPDAEERIAGVTALGLSGTNAHVVISSPPTSVEEPSEFETRGKHLLLLSARNETSLRALAEGYSHAFQSDQDCDLGDVCYTAAVGRKHLDLRIAALVDNVSQAVESLDATASFASSFADELDSTTHGIARLKDDQLFLGEPVQGRKTAWAFGSAIPDMKASGAVLLKTEPAFRATLERLDGVLASHLQTKSSTQTCSLVQTLLDEESGVVDGIDGLLSFAVQAGLAAVWRSWGLEPDVVFGDGVGQYVATAIAGGLGWDDALKLVYEQERVKTKLGEDALQSEKLAPDAEAMLEQFESFADLINYFPPDRPLICSLTGEVVPIHKILGGSYWRRLLVETANREASLESLAKQSCTIIMSLGPHLELKGDEIPVELTQKTLHLSSLEPGKTPAESLFGSLAQLYVLGATIDFRTLYGHTNNSIASLPNYPFQRKRFWITELGQYA